MTRERERERDRARTEGGSPNSVSLSPSESKREIDPAVKEFDLDAFSSAQFQDAITQRRKAEDLSAVLYPNVPVQLLAAFGFTL